MKRFFSYKKPTFDIKAIIIFAIMIIITSSSFSYSEIGAEYIPKHHTNNGFRNYPVIPEPPSSGIALYLRRFWFSIFLPDVSKDHYIPEKYAIRQFQHSKNHDSITWIGHATFLIKINGLVILTDPFLSKHASPIQGLGPKRFVQPGISLENLPPIDLIVVSHNHLDHLDAETIEFLPGKEKIHVFTPLGLKPFFKDRGYTHVEELDWNESSSSGGIKLTALPAVHFSGRGLNDKNKTLWCSWSISSQFTKLFFAGDTTYSSTIFKTIGKKWGPFDIAFVPIGAYRIGDIESAHHLNPEEAIKMAEDTKSEIAVAMHWGTIELSDEPPWEPPVRFKKAAQDNGISSDQIWLMKIGETRLLPSKKKK